jgi:hypothetical protein
MSLPKFYVGQRVVAITDSDMWKKGDEFTVKKVECRCCMFVVGIGMVADGKQSCSECGKYWQNKDGQYVFDEDCFAPMLEDFERITFSKVMQQEPVSVN